MECSGDSQWNRPFAFQLLTHLAYGLRTPGDHNLSFAVVIGNAHAIDAVHELVQLIPVKADHGGHGAATCSRHQFGTRFHQAQACFQVKHPCGIERHQFPEAVTGNQGGLASLLDQVVDQQGLHDEESGLRVAGVVQVVRAIAAAALPTADRQQVPPQQFRCQGEACIGTTHVQQLVGHADLL